MLVGLVSLLGQDLIVDLLDGLEQFEGGETLPHSQKTSHTLIDLIGLYFVQLNRYECTYYSKRLDCKKSRRH